MGRKELEGEIEREAYMNHLRSLRKEDLRWPRENVITVAEGLFLIREWVIVMSRKGKVPFQ